MLQDEAAQAGGAPDIAPSVADLIEGLRGPGPHNAYLESCLERWERHEHLSFEEARQAFFELLKDDVSDFQIGRLLVSATPEFLMAAEIAGFASALRDRARPVELPQAEHLGDTCGTGGDTIPTFNVSTTVMFILAADGIPIAKHGNRAFTSRCGSADVLQHLGVRIDLPGPLVKACIERAGIGFMFAPVFHTATQRVQRIRKILAQEMPANLRMKTVFNVLGPLSNPARTPWQMLGVYSRDFLVKLADVLQRLGAKRAVIVYGRCERADYKLKGLDEVSILGPTDLVELKDGKIRETVITLEHLGLSQAQPEDIKGGDVSENAAILEGILKGEIRGPRRDLVLANAAVGLALGRGSPERLEDALGAFVNRAAALIDSGAAYHKLDELRRISQELAAKA
jgi:anthranilate phosphoribosyltransferase